MTPPAHHGSPLRGSRGTAWAALGAAAALALAACGKPAGSPSPTGTTTATATSGPSSTASATPGSVELCGSVAGARTWWASPEGQQVKAVATSLTAG